MRARVKRYKGGAERQREAHSSCEASEKRERTLSREDKRITMSGVRSRLLLAMVIVVVVLLIAESTARPSLRKRQAKLMRYLQKYGYLNKPKPYGRPIPHTKKTIRLAVRRLQRFRGLRENGNMADTKTLDLVEKRRCGMGDMGPSDLTRRKRRYALQGSSWKKNEITFKIDSYTDDLSKDVVHSTITKALTMWSQLTPLKFTEITDPGKKADIMFQFVSGYHGDDRPADGPGKELAHAFFPLDNEGLAGDVHFDKDEKFTVNDDQNTGVDLLWLAVHELGHSLGLDHSYHPDSIMFPFYIGYKPDLQLYEDDINGIQALYGKSDSERVTPTPHTDPTPSPNVPDKCNVTLDAIVMTKDKKTLAFSGEYLWEIGEFGAGDPIKIQDAFPDLPPNIDAAFTRRETGHTYFFKGTRAWVYENRNRISGPIDITEIKLPSVLYDMDAALEWKRNGKIYFFKGEQYWRFDPARQAIDSGYPRQIVTAWRGLPANINGALQWENGNSYFFQGKNYYAFDDMKVRTKPGYPRAVGSYWMGCGAQRPV